MHQVIRLFFLIPGLIHLLPVAGVLGADRLEELYGQRFVGNDLLLLLQHRAVMFGLIGALLVAAAIRPQLRLLATIAGVVSMGSYMLLALPLSSHGAAIQRVFWVDAIAIVLLVVGSLLSGRFERRARRY